MESTDLYPAAYFYSPSTELYISRDWKHIGKFHNKNHLEIKLFENSDLDLETIKNILEDAEKTNEKTFLRNFLELNYFKPI